MCSVGAERVHFTSLLFVAVLLMFKDLLLTSLTSSYSWTVAILGSLFVFQDSAFKVIFLLIFTELSRSLPSNKQGCNDLLCCDLSSARDMN